jgi:hypothetical protein
MISAVLKPYFMWGMVVHVYNPSCSKSGGRRIKVEASLGKVRSYLK